jgi:Domain of unknown function (DUF4160)
MSADLQAIKLRVERSLPPDVVADMREAGIVLTLEAENGHSRPLVGISDELAELELLGDMASFPTEDTGVDHTIFISTKIGVRHAPRIKLAIDPPDSFSPGSVTASIAIDSGEVVAGKGPPVKVLKQVQQFIELNRDLLLEYWACRISTAEFGRRMKRIGASR